MGLKLRKDESINDFIGLKVEFKVIDYTIKILEDKPCFLYQVAIIKRYVIKEKNEDVCKEEEY